MDITRYKKLTDIQHVRQRPSIYIGSMEFTSDREIETYDPSKDKPIERIYGCIGCDSLNTMFNELVNNAYDERVRGKAENRAQIVDRISAIVCPATGKIAVWDNGGIPIIKHPEYDEWLPEMLFGALRSGSNFTEDRGMVSGTNGVGASLVNVMSKQFKVMTAKDGKMFECTWSNNMSDKTDAVIKNTSKSNHFTYIEAYLDLESWELAPGEKLQSLPQDVVNKWLSRCIEIAVMGSDVSKPLTVEFHEEDSNGKDVRHHEWSFKHFWEYKDLWQDTEQFRGDENFNEETGELNYAFEIGPSRNGYFESFAIVNSIRCDYGKHMDFIANVCADYIIEHVKSKHDYDLTKQKKDIFKHMSILSMWNIPNPSFTTQTKETLATPTSKFGFDINISEKLKKHLLKTDLLERIVAECHVKKQLAEEKQRKKEQKEMNDKLTVKTKQFYVNKLVDASKKGDRTGCELFIVEGDSASQGLRSYRDGLMQGYYCMRGKSIGNTYYENEKRLINKPELAGLMQSIGLRFGQRADAKTLRYTKISILTDADVDGDSICAMISLFFLKFWPELYEQGIIQHIMAPLVVATKGSEKLYFYTAKEFDASEQQLVDAKYRLDYKKGLAAMTSEEFEYMLTNPVHEQFVADELAWQAFDAWFGNNSNIRKELMGFENV